MAHDRPALGGREKQALDIVYARGSATAADVREDMVDAPTDAAVRTTFRVLVAKRHLRIERDGPRFVYWPTVPRETAQRSELRHVLSTFFGGSVESALATLLDMTPGSLDDTQRRRLKSRPGRARTSRWPLPLRAAWKARTSTSCRSSPAYGSPARRRRWSRCSLPSGASAA